MGKKVRNRTKDLIKWRRKELATNILFKSNQVISLWVYWEPWHDIHLFKTFQSITQGITGNCKAWRQHSDNLRCWACQFVRHDKRNPWIIPCESRPVSSMYRDHASSYRWWLWSSGEATWDMVIWHICGTRSKS